MPIQRITSGILADGAILAADIADGIVISSKLASTLSISGNFLANNVTANTNLIVLAGSAAAPSIFPSGDTNTGIFFPAADQVGIATNGVERVEFGNNETVFNDGGADVDFRVEGDTEANLLFVDASTDRVGIGTSSPSQKLHVVGKTLFATSSGAIESGFTSGGSNAFALLFATSTSGTLFMGVNGTAAGSPIDVSGILDNASYFGSRTNHATQFLTNNTVRATITSDGYVLVGCTALPSSSVTGVSFSPSVTSVNPHFFSAGSGTGSVAQISFINGNGTVGQISTSGSSTTYAVSSDYRLKENIAPMTGALATVAQLNPVTYTWKVDGSAGQGFIAHELQAVVPDCVAGEKDAVDNDGNPRYQGVDTSFLVATLTAAIQELKAINDAQAIRIETLEAKVAALKTNT